MIKYPSLKGSALKGGISGDPPTSTSCDSEKKEEQSRVNVMTVVEPQQSPTGDSDKS